jgi:deazaflavin-dependent oxidoreductase (nitroreductase family)
MTLYEPPTGRSSAAVIPPGRLLCGLQLPIQSLSPQLADPWEHTVGPRQLEAVVKQADESGFFYVAVDDRVAVSRALSGRLGTTWYDPITTLAWIAAMTQRLRLLARSQVLGVRHPVVAAKAWLTLDRLSAGRGILGVSRGDDDGLFAGLGLDPDERDSLLDDGLEMLDAAFADEFPERATSHWSVAGLGLGPRPVQRPLPTWICGSTDADIQRAARRGDGWLPDTVAGENFASQVAELRRQRATAVGELPIDIGALAPPIYVGKADWDVGPESLVGSADKVASALISLGAQGANHVLLRFRSRSDAELLDQLEAFGRDVVPQLDPNGQRSEKYDEPSFREIAQISRLHVQAMETSDAEEVWGAIGNELLLLETAGRTTGKPHRVSLAFWRDRSGAPILVGSYAGAPHHPDWVLNLANREANPYVTVRVRGRAFTADAEFLDGTDYDDVWRQLTLDRPSYRNYSARTNRRFALVRLHER